MADEPIATTATYNDDDLVYVDPENRVVVSKVEFKENGLPKTLAMPMPSFALGDDDEADAKLAATPAETKPADAKTPVAAKPGALVKGKDRRPPRKPRQRFYPWGTYKTMKKLFKLEGKVPEPERTLTLDDVMVKALQEPYWD